MDHKYLNRLKLIIRPRGRYWIVYIISRLRSKTSSPRKILFDGRSETFKPFRLVQIGHRVKFSSVTYVLERNPNV